MPRTLSTPQEQLRKIEALHAGATSEGKPGDALGGRSQSRAAGGVRTREPEIDRSDFPDRAIDDNWGHVEEGELHLALPGTHSSTQIVNQTFIESAQ